MGIEQKGLQGSATTYHPTLNLLDIQQGTKAPGSNESSQDLSLLAVLPAGAPAFPQLNFAGLPNFPRETNNPNLDFTPIIYPSAPVAEATEVAKPKNKYEATIKEQIGYLDDEAKFTPHTKDALARDADKYPPKRNEKDGTTTYTIEQFGLTDRDQATDQKGVAHYKRLVTITVPDKADSLKDCQFEYQDRQKIDEKEFTALVARAQKRQVDQSSAADKEHKLPRPDDIAFYTHGIRTGAEGADFQALALQLTHGHSVINVDWKSTPPAEEKVGMSDAYAAERKGAAQSYARFEKVLDDTIGRIGADHTDMIAFSHGAMFDTRYLQHRKDSHAPMLNQVIFTHPDVPISVLPQPDKDGKVEPSNRLYACVAKTTHVIGSTEDLALTGAAYNDCEPCKSDNFLDQLQEKNRQMAIHARIGNGAPICRNLVAGCGGTYVMETIPAGRKDSKKDALKHFINMHGISNLINGSDKKAMLATTRETKSVEDP